jgi:hypothetical protein
LLSAYCENCDDEPTGNDIRTAHIFALYNDQNEVTNWEYDNSDHIIPISQVDGNYPVLTVADLNNDGTLEVCIADEGKVYVWKADGNLFNENYPIEVDNLECPGIAPLVANVDNDPENELIIASHSAFHEDYIYAFNLDGSLVEGFPLLTDGLKTTPAIGDINHDGLNEIVAVYGGYVNVWKTEGETGHDEWPLYRQNTFNNAAYEEPACEYDPNDPLVYEEENNQINWDGYNVLTSDLIIPDGEILIIEGRVAMPDGAKIIVQQGGRLEVTGGVITSACSGFWKGIEVWGYSDKSQLDEAFPPGVIILSDNAKVENAECAIATIKIVNNQADYDCTGGIVIAKHTTFLNNIYGVMFYDYTNFIPVPPYTEINNRSYFEVCDFLTNGDLAIPGCTPKAFLWMNNVFGISLYGNYFVNSTGNKWSWYDRGIGIETYFSVYTIDEGCMTNNIPCDDIRKSYFNNLYYGIRSSGNGMPNRAISVAHSIFDLNQHGIFISTMDNAHVLFNTFTIAKRANDIDPYNYGLYVEYSTGYSIEENSFSEKSLGFFNNIGMYINNSGRDPNEVYKNNFKNLEYGIVAYGQNRDEEGAGLCLKCNNFETCKNDIHVIPEKDEQGNWLRGRPQGIAFSQGTGGSDTSPAGNTFTDVEELPTTFNYFNHENCNLIDYHYHQTYPDPLIIKPDPRSELMVHLTEEIANFQDEDHACPSNFGGGSLNLNLERNTINSENEQVIIYSDSIQALKDGGDTYSLNFDVFTSTTDEAYDIRQQLLDESPYLSDTVIKSAIYKENVLPNAMIRDVLVANPQSAKSSEILDKVDERIEPMPEEMMEDILEGRTIKGDLEILEDQLAAHQTAKYSSLRKLESNYKQDTLDFQGSQDSLISLWESLPDPSIQYKLTLFYLNQGDSLNCFSTLNLIPQLNNLSSEELAEFTRYTEFINLIWPLRNNDVIIDSLRINQLFILSQSESVPGTMARNFLVANEFMDYIEPIYLSDELKSTSIIPERPKNNADKNHRLKVFPNPAKDYIIVSYDLSDLAGNVTLRIYSTEGKPLFQYNIGGVENQIIISTESLSSSQYFIQLLNGIYVIESINFIISK